MTTTWQQDNKQFILNELQNMHSLSSDIGFSKKQQSDNRLILSLLIQLDESIYNIHLLQSEIKIRNNQIIYRKKMLSLFEALSSPAQKILKKKIVSDEKHVVTLGHKLKSLEKEYSKVKEKLFQFI